MSNIPMPLQFKLILTNREPEHISEEALHIARIAVIAQHTGWSYAELKVLPQDVAIDLATFYALKDAHDDSSNRMERALERIGDKLENLANMPTAELISWSTQRRLKRLLDVLLGPEADDDADEDRDSTPLERWLEASFGKRWQ